MKFDDGYQSLILRLSPVHINLVQLMTLFPIQSIFDFRRQSFHKRLNSKCLNAFLRRNEITFTGWLYTEKAKIKSVRFLVIGRLQNRCGDAGFFSRPYFDFANREIRDTLHTGTIFPRKKVWWLREASQIRQTFIPLCEKSRLKHSMAEFQSIQQCWLQLDIVS